MDVEVLGEVFELGETLHHLVARSYCRAPVARRTSIGASVALAALFSGWGTKLKLPFQSRLQRTEINLSSLLRVLRAERQ